MDELDCSQVVSVKRDKYLGLVMLDCSHTISLDTNSVNR